MKNPFAHSFLMILYFLIFANTVQAAERKYQVSEIAENLKAGNAVIRKQVQELEIISDKKAILHYYKAITILNESGSTFADVAIYFDTFSKVKVKSARIYDARGNLVKKIQANKFVNKAVYSNSFLEDVRALHNNMEYMHYPYTIEYAYTVQYSSLFLLPGWHPLDDYELGVEYSSFQVTAKDMSLFRFNEQNIEAKKLTGKKSGLIWQVYNVEPRTRSVFPVAKHLKAPKVNLAPNRFELSGYKANAADWKSFGKFFYDLNSKQNDLDAKAKAEIQALIKNVTDKEEAARILYSYLQNSCRYVSIQLGIGGWQSFKTSFVHQNKFGDCKALTYYMKAMLDEAEIESYPVLIKAGANAQNIITGFPSNQFNHVILAIPSEKDTTWLECTSSNNPFGYLGSFTQNRNALWITSDGGKMVHTPIVTGSENQLFTNSKVKVNAHANAVMNTQIKFKGTFQDNLRYYKTEATTKDLKQFFYNQFIIPAFTLKQFTVQEPDPNIPEINCAITLNIPALGQQTSSSFYLNPNVLLKKLVLPPYINQYPEEFARHSFTIVDSVEIELPEGFYLSNLPEPIEFRTSQAIYQKVFKTLSNGNLIYIRKYSQQATAKEIFIDKQFYESILMSDKNIVVFNKE